MTKDQIFMSKSKFFNLACQATHIKIDDTLYTMEYVELEKELIHYRDSENYPFNMSYHLLLNSSFKICGKDFYREFKFFKLQELGISGPWNDFKSWKTMNLLEND